MVSAAKKQSMALMETDYSKHKRKEDPKITDSFTHCQYVNYLKEKRKLSRFLEAIFGRYQLKRDHLR